MVHYGFSIKTNRNCRFRIICVRVCNIIILVFWISVFSKSEHKMEMKTKVVKITSCYYEGFVLTFTASLMTNQLKLMTVLYSDLHIWQRKMIIYSPEY